MVDACMNHSQEPEDYTLNPITLNPTTLNPTTLNPINPKPYNPITLNPGKLHRHTAIDKPSNLL